MYTHNLSYRPSTGFNLPMPFFEFTSDDVCDHLNIDPVRSYIPCDRCFASRYFDYYAKNEAVQGFFEADNVAAITEYLEACRKMKNKAQPDFMLKMAAARYDCPLILEYLWKIAGMYTKKALGLRLRQAAKLGHENILAHFETLRSAGEA